MSFGYKYLPNTTDWYGRWRLKANASNDYFIDREVQRHDSYTGIEGLEIQDIAITESMGPVVDHRMEHLAPSDIMVARTRRRLAHAAQNLADKGITPPGAANPDAYATAWGGFVNAGADRNWLDVFKDSIPSGRARVLQDA